MGLVLFGTRRAAVLPGRAARRIPLVPRGAVRGGERPVVPRDLRESDDRGHGPAGDRRPAPQLRAGLQSARHDQRRVPRQDADPLRRFALRREQLRAMDPATLDAWRASELAAVKLPYLGIACVVLFWALLVALAKFPPLAQRAAAQTPRCRRGGFSGLSALPALLARRVRAVRVRRRAGGRVELPDPLHAVQFPGHHRKSPRPTTCSDTLVLFFAGRFIGTLLMSKFRPAAAARHVRRGRHRVVRHRARSRAATSGCMR